ncbi:MAG TPA: hypothetical protein VGO64_10045 [Candidatus Limnocylindrales bacterium]|nr:hypothetical protein [Candidatus Limnocylindrales bacterium]
MIASPLSFYRRLPSLRRTQRRVAVAAAFAGYPLLQIGYATLVAPGGVATGAVATAIWTPIAIALFVLTLVGVFTVYGYARDRMVPGWFPFFRNAASDRHPLDERQRAMHDRSLVVSYRVLTIAVGLTIGAAAGVASNEPIVLDFPALLPFIVVFALYVPFLPYAVLAWIEEDVPADEDGLVRRAPGR